MDREIDLQSVRVPEEDLKRAFEAGAKAKEEGKDESACPFVLPAMQAQWLGGWDSVF